MDIIAQSERLIITKMTLDMAESIFLNSQDEDNKRFVPDEVFDSVEVAKEVIEGIIESYDSEKGPFIYAVIRKEDNANIGYVQLVKIEEGYEIGYHIAKKYTRNGYASEAVNCYLNYLKDNSDLKIVYGVALYENKASLKVLEKCGFELIFKGIGMYQGEPKEIVKTIRKL